MNERTDVELSKYWRTGKGSHRHANRYCANARRSIFTGDEFRIPAAEVKDWAPCEACCTAEEVAAFAAAQVAKTEAEAEIYCTNRRPVPGSYNPRLYQVRGTCGECGATKVSIIKQGMNLRKHRRPAK